MRAEKESILKEELRVLALKTRDRLNLTQKEMARKLAMSENSYSDIETGLYMCGTLTAILLLTEQENPIVFLQELKIKFEKLYETEMQTV